MKVTGSWSDGWRLQIHRCTVVPRAALDIRENIHVFAAYNVKHVSMFLTGAELVDSVLDVVRKEAECCDCLQVCRLLLHFFFFVLFPQLSHSQFQGQSQNYMKLVTVIGTAEIAHQLPNNGII